MGVFIFEQSVDTEGSYDEPPSRGADFCSNDSL